MVLKEIALKRKKKENKSNTEMCGVSQWDCKCYGNFETNFISFYGQHTHPFINNGWKVCICLLYNYLSFSPNPQESQPSYPTKQEKIWILNQSVAILIFYAVSCLPEDFL